MFERAAGEPRVTFEQLTAAETGASPGEVADEELAATEEAEGREMGEQAGSTEPTQPDQAAEILSAPTDVAASDIIGREVVDEEGQPVGSVHALVELQEGGFAAVVVADEFLGIGERQLAIPLDNLALAADALVVVDLNAEALAQSPEWDQTLAARDLAPQDTTQIRVWQMPEGAESQE